MMFDIKKHKNDLLFTALGGVSEIGMNVSLYHLNEKFIIIDLGLGFAGYDLPGVSITLPKLNFIERNKRNLLGLILTHAHEDHVGAVPYLWHKLACPIYATKLTAEVVKGKFDDFGIREGKSSINIVEPEKIYNLGPFSIEMIGLNHSIPEMHGIMIRTNHGNLFHTGDWKIDPNPIIGKEIDRDKLNKLGDEGILAVISDSTNIFNKDTPKSEGDLGKSLQDLIKTFCKGLGVITTFSSNIARLHSIFTAARVVNRKVALAGRSLQRFYSIALASGYLAEFEPPITVKQAATMKRSDVLLVCTGCQGEELAAVNKLANDDHPDIKLHKGDTIIFSSKIIPGNEKRIYALFNKFCRKRVEVLTEHDHFVHVSGHPVRAEIKQMYKMLRPKIVIPAHGETMHLHEHCRFAKELGINNCIEVIDGDVILLSQKNSEIIGRISEVGCLGVDGNYIVDESSVVFEDRRILRDHGIIIISALINKNGKLVRMPKVFAPGVLDISEDSQVSNMLIQEISNNIKSLKNHTHSSLTKIITNTVEKFIRQERGKQPKIIVNIDVI